MIDRVEPLNTNLIEMRWKYRNKIYATGFWYLDSLFYLGYVEGLFDIFNYRIRRCLVPIKWPTFSGVHEGTEGRWFLFSGVLQLFDQNSN